MLLTTACAVCRRSGHLVCPSCAAALAPEPSLAVPLHLDSCQALFAYDDLARPLITGLKNHHRRDLVAWLADRLVARPWHAATATWAPTSPARRRTRGFDQAELLARALARRRGLPLRALLSRVPGPPQSGASATARRSNPGFVAVGPVSGSVLLVDDVATTGATLTAAARALRSAGADEIHGLVVARAPRSR